MRRHGADTGNTAVVWMEASRRHGQDAHGSWLLRALAELDVVQAAIQIAADD